MSILLSTLLRRHLHPGLKLSSTALSQQKTNELIGSKCFASSSSSSSSSSKPPPSTSDDLRERARQRIAEVEAQQLLSPNSPIGILDRSPGTDPNAAAESAAAAAAAEGQTNVIDVEAVAFAPFPNNTNPSTGEVKGPTGPEPTRYGDWERKGRCSDF